MPKRSCLLQRGYITETRTHLFENHNSLKPHPEDNCILTTTNINLHTFNESKKKIILKLLNYSLASSSNSSNRQNVINHVCTWQSFHSLFFSKQQNVSRTSPVKTRIKRIKIDSLDRRSRQYLQCLIGAGS